MRSTPTVYGVSLQRQSYIRGNPPLQSGRITPSEPKGEVSRRSNTEVSFNLVAYPIAALIAITLLIVFFSGQNDTGPMPDDAVAAVRSDDSDTPGDKETASAAPAAAPVPAAMAQAHSTLSIVKPDPRVTSLPPSEVASGTASTGDSQ